MKVIQSTLPAPQFQYQFPDSLSDICFFDIETTGLSPKASSLYLIGAAFWDTVTQSWKLIQWFADDYRSEVSIITSFFESLKTTIRLYHFNGNTFDIPYIRAKCEKHQIDIPEDIERLFTTNSIDILKGIRPLKKKLSLQKANQTALEHWLGIQREDEYDGSKLIAVYTQYMQKKIMEPSHSQELLHLLLLHNHDDIGGMLEVCSILGYQDLLTRFHLLQPETITVVQQVQDAIDCLTVSFQHPFTLPRQATMLHDFSGQDDLLLQSARLHLCTGMGALQLPIYHGTLKYFFADYKNYYYLPEEDIAMHRSVAEFVDKQHRKKATAATCYLKKNGYFLPSLLRKHTSENLPCFYQNYRSRPAFVELPDNLADISTDFLSQYLSDNITADF